MRNRHWKKDSKYGKYRMLTRIKENPGLSIVQIAERHTRGISNVKEHIAEGLVRREGTPRASELYITDKGIEMLYWQDHNFPESY